MQWIGITIDKVKRELIPVKIGVSSLLVLLECLFGVRGLVSN